MQLQSRVAASKDKIKRKASHRLGGAERGQIAIRRP